MVGIGFLSTFPISRHVTFRNSQPYFTHITPRCSTQAKKTTGKKRARQRLENPPEHGKIISDVAVGDEFVGTIAEVGPANSSWVDIGVFTKGGRPVHARLPFPVTRVATRNDVKGAVVPVYVKWVNRHAGRIEVRRGVKPQHGNENPLVVSMLDSLHVGDKLKGTVVGLGQYGAVLDANVYRRGKRAKQTACHGLLQRKNFRKEWYSAADQVVRSDAERCISMGDTVEVYVRAAHVQNAFLLFDGDEVRAEDVAEARRQHRSTERRRSRRPPVDSLEVGEVRDGIVADIARYGLFVDVGVKSNGLIHYSEMGERHKADWKEAVGIKTALTVEVLGLDENGVSLRLISIKEEELREALAVAESATARKRDVELAAALQISNKRGHGSSISPSDNLDRLKVTHQSKTNELLTSDVEAGEAIDDGAEHNMEHRQDEEEPDKFSDEYFEDKYGF